EQYYLIIPDLSLFAEGNTLPAAYELMEREKERYFQNIVKSNSWDMVKEPSNTFQIGTNIKKIMPFLLKLSSSVIVIGLIIMLIGGFFFNRLELVVTNSMGNVLSTGYTFIREKNHEFNVMTEEERQEYKILIRKKMLQIKPFADEIKILWENTNPEVPLKQHK
ncbi:hypothetical protein LLG96_11760, partial [bacterium]|nr:hypothetical protein [bacterium]